MIKVHRRRYIGESDAVYAVMEFTRLNLALYYRLTED